MTTPAAISDLRREYAMMSLDRHDVLDDPMQQFRRWFEDAQRASLPEPNAMTLATVDAAGRPSARVVLLKAAESDGFVFFTNYDSRKAAELDASGFAALVFLWKELERQVRVEGRVARVSSEESSAYFAMRPRGSRLGAWASPQSAVIPDRAWLEHALTDAEARFSGTEVPCPPQWGGYRVVPDVVEFWQGRPSRLHDRIRYRKASDGWAIERLAP
ncbi:MAG: Pyridoxine/pyridoxamine 5'-phosphate oxidase [Gemmatimonadaceae bacterium]|nr:Pyridoxine/pyridoxamine 5'-phosphate oxidase [Gemmatimonadaceae bacterium]